MDFRQVVITIIATVAFLASVWVIAKYRRNAALSQNIVPGTQLVAPEVDSNSSQSVSSQPQEQDERLHLFRLRGEERERFIGEWRYVQSRFVDDPGGAVAQANALVTRIMAVRGYPSNNFEQRIAGLTATHPAAVAGYREAYRVAIRHQSPQIATEDFRHALLTYRSLFDDVLDAGTNVHRVDVRRQEVA
jgi:hypothetical protein